MGLYEICHSAYPPVCPNTVFYRGSPFPCRKGFRREAFGARGEGIGWRICCFAGKKDFNPRFRIERSSILNLEKQPSPLKRTAEITKRYRIMLYLAGKQGFQRGCKPLWPVRQDTYSPLFIMCKHDEQWGINKEINFTPFSSKHLFRKDSQSFFDLSHSLVR